MSEPVTIPTSVPPRVSDEPLATALTGKDRNGVVLPVVGDAPENAPVLPVVLRVSPESLADWNANSPHGDEPGSFVEFVDAIALDLRDSRSTIDRLTAELKDVRAESARLTKMQSRLVALGKDQLRAFEQERARFLALVTGHEPEWVVGTEEVVGAITDQHRELARLTTENLALRQDKDRVDWMEENERMAICWNVNEGGNPDNGWTIASPQSHKDLDDDADDYGGKTLRDAIDWAIKSESPPREQEDGR